VSKDLFSALTLAVVIALFASYFVAVTVVPLYSARYLQPTHSPGGPQDRSALARFHIWFNARFDVLLNGYERSVRQALGHPREVLYGFGVLFLLSFLLLPFIGVSFFPRTDAGQFVINVKAPTGTRIELTEKYVEKVEAIVRQVVPSPELNTVVSNIGLMPDLSSLFTPNSGMHTAFVEVGLNEDHRVNSYVYMNRVRERVEAELPELRTYFQSGGLVDSVLNQGAPAPIDVQVSGAEK
jgi:multidrug efflux pump subunit AcrB